MKTEKIDPRIQGMLKEIRIHLGEIERYLNSSPRENTSRKKKDNRSPSVNVNIVVKTLEDVTGIKSNQIIAKARGEGTISDVRKMAMYLCYARYELGSQKTIGKCFGRDHTAVAFAVKTTADFLEHKNKKFCAMFEACVRILDPELLDPIEPLEDYAI